MGLLTSRAGIDFVGAGVAQRKRYLGVSNAVRLRFTSVV